jgi:hypothetical protein
MRGTAGKLALGCVSLVCVAAVAGCGDGGGDDGGGGAKSPGPARSSKPPKPPEPHGPKLEMKGASFPYTFQVVKAELATETMDGRPVPAGDYDLQVLAVVRSAEPGRSIGPPGTADIPIREKSCKEKDVDLCAPPSLEPASDFYPKGQVDGEGKGMGKGEESWGHGKLEGDEDYYVTWHSEVGEDFSADGAKLCNQYQDEGPCIPLGKVKKPAGTGS